MGVKQQTVILVFNSVLVDGYAFFFKCMTVGQALDFMMVPV